MKNAKANQKKSTEVITKQEGEDSDSIGAIRFGFQVFGFGKFDADSGQIRFGL